MLKKKFLVTSYLLLALGLTACTNGDVQNDGPAKENPPIEENNAEKDNNDVNDSEDVNNNNENVDTDVEVNVNDKEEVDPGFNGTYGEIMIVNDAYDIFVKDNANANIQEIELVYNNNEYMYEIKGFDESNVYKMTINAISGKVMKYKEESEKKDKDYVTADHINRVEEFLNKAIQDSGDDIEFIEWNLEIEDGRPELEIEVEKASGDVDYTYDLESGTLLEKDQ